MLNFLYSLLEKIQNNSKHLKIQKITEYIEHINGQSI